MTKPKSHKQPRKAGKHEKGAKPPEAVEAQAPAAEPGQRQLPVAAEAPPEAASPPASEAPAAEPQVPEPAQPEVATSTEPAPEPAAPEPAAPEPAAPAKIKGKRAPKEPGPKKTSALDAAVKVLAESGEAMTTQAMIEAMAAKGYWASPGGQMPAATLYSGILRELSTKGEQARFVKTQRGKFGLRSPQ